MVGELLMNLAPLYIRLQHYDRFQVDQMMPEVSNDKEINYNGTNSCILLIALSHGIRLYVDKIAIDLHSSFTCTTLHCGIK